MLLIDSRIFHNGRAGILTWPMDSNALNAIGFAQSERGYQLALAEIPAGGGDLAALLAVLGFQDDPCADGAAIGTHAVALQLEANPVMTEVVVVAQHQGGTAVADENHIEIAVAVEIGVDAAAADERLKQIGTGRFFRHRLEAP